MGIGNGVEVQKSSDWAGLLQGRGVCSVEIYGQIYRIINSRFPK